MDHNLDGIRTGRVIEFSAKRGYGFIEDCESTMSIFCHYSSLFQHKTKCFRELFSGEYVEFYVMQDRMDRLSACKVTGIKDGPLMCSSMDRIT
jgi:cold shock CspA family protein